MKGVFLYRSVAGHREVLHVREVTDPAAARAILEQILDRPVRWEPR